MAALTTARLAGRVCVVNGAASVIGQAVAERFAGEGGVVVGDNNTGLMDPGDRSTLDTSLQTWRRVQDANLTSIFLSCKHGIPHLRDTEPAGGSVINAASFLAGLGAATAQMAYAAAKAGVVQLTRDLGVHLARSGVRVNAVLFGPIDTPGQRAVFERNPGALETRSGTPVRGGGRSGGWRHCSGRCSWGTWTWPSRTWRARRSEAGCTPAAGSWS